jgi:hypothetical protein
MGTRGWVYVISNKSMPGLAKIGYSSKDPHGRAQELDNTGCPLPYVVEYDVLVESPREVEQQAHQQLSEKREGKEWFRCSLEEAIATVDAIAIRHPAQPSYRASPVATQTPIPPSQPAFTPAIQHSAQPKDSAPTFAVQHSAQSKEPTPVAAVKPESFIAMQSGHATVIPTPVKCRKGVTPLISFPRYLRTNRSARWRFRTGSFTLEEKAGTRRYGPDRYNFDPSVNGPGFVVEDRSVLWVCIDDVELSD